MTYQSIYKGHVAKFHDTFKTCIGNRADPPIVMKDKSNKEVKKDKKRYYTKENARAANCVPVARIHSDVKAALGDGTQGMSFSAQPDVLSVTKPTSVDARTHNVDIRDQLLDAETKLYVEGKGILKDENSAPELSAEMFSNQQKIANYNKRLREEPSNILLWLEFVKFQDRIGNSLSEEGDVKAQAKLSKSAIYEKKVAIMKKAMDANQGNVELKLKYLELCQETWEPHQINKELENMLFIHPTDLSLWKHFLLFNQCRLSTFSVGRVCKLYQRCIKTLQKYGDAKVHTVKTAGNVQQKLLGTRGGLFYLQLIIR